MKKLITITLSLWMLTSLALSQESGMIPMSPENWTFNEEAVSFTEHLGVPAIYSNSDNPIFSIKDMEFENGIIEYDVIQDEAVFLFVYFREESQQEKEAFYLRPYRAGDPKGPDALQYTSINKGVTMWDMHGHYQGPGNIKSEGWNHVKLVISGKQMLAYVNDMEQPALVIPHMEGEAKSGGISFQGKGYYANVSIRPNEVEGLSPESGPDPTYHDPHYLRAWEVSEVFPFPFGEDLTDRTIPADSAIWEPIQAERMGLINLTRKYGSGRTEETGRSIAWIKTTITAEEKQVRKLQLGFSDEVWVLINKQLLYLDKNYYNSPIMKPPYGRISIENTSIDLPLQKGENEIMIGVGNFFFGWGIIARLDKVDGLSFP